MSKSPKKISSSANEPSSSAAVKKTGVHEFKCDYPNSPCRCVESVARQMKELGFSDGWELRAKRLEEEIERLRGLMRRLEKSNEKLNQLAEAVRKEQDWLRTHDWTYPLYAPDLYGPVKDALAALDSSSA